MEGVARELGGASDVPRMLSTPEPEPVEEDAPILDEDMEDEDEVRKKEDRRVWYQNVVGVHFRVLT